MGLLVIVVLLLVVMPALLYFLGAGVARYTRKAPAWFDFPERRHGGHRPG